MFRLFEKLVHPYPDAEPAPPPKAFFAFLWAGTRGLRPYLLALTVLSAGIGAFEARAVLAALARTLHVRRHNIRRPILAPRHAVGSARHPCTYGERRCP